MNNRAQRRLTEKLERKEQKKRIKNFISEQTKRVERIKKLQTQLNETNVNGDITEELLLSTDDINNQLRDILNEQEKSKQST